MATTLNHQLKDKLRNTQAAPGRVVFGSGPAAAEDSKPIGVATEGDVKATVPLAANDDTLLNRAEGSVGQKLGADVVGKTGDQATGNLTPSPDDLFTTEEVVLTEDERNTFLDALVSGTRYERRFSLYDGRVKGRLRNRSTEESEAIAAWMNHGVRESKYKSALEYALVMRNALLASQVMELNGVRYPELPTPLFRTQTGDKIEDPAWPKVADTWSKQPEPVVAAVYEELRTFERKYWTMVVHARDQNFWHPAEST